MVVVVVVVVVVVAAGVVRIIFTAKLTFLSNFSGSPPMAEHYRDKMYPCMTNQPRAGRYTQ